MEGYTKTHTFQVSKTINAPLRFVYRWCTDYRESDPNITGSKTKRKILMKTQHRAIYVSTYTSSGKPRSIVNVVTLHLPRAWHLDAVGDEIDEKVDYVLTKLGPRRTRLDIAFTGHYKTDEVPTKAQDAKEVNELWDKYVAALEKDYGRQKRSTLRLVTVFELRLQPTDKRVLEYSREPVSRSCVF